MTKTPRAAVETYFDAWRERDFARFRSVLADDVTFRGPLGTADNADEARAGIEGLSKIVTGIDVVHRFVDGPDVLTWFELRTADAPPVPTANWSHVVDGLITRIRVTFDPRPLLPGPGR
ncbi:nuclear transport factor 2 family protein [Actinokineospora auranticolor]|uniref:SnoaL-like protein n=1 Tax=Actinokineospora auranticolor TaxID=155976 RepID=A0A2S6GM45_9PSEU|nr:nuclear transport factor 2 family protein [Actinokineospora auranticolor]PPK66312.1 SnoaL-like protein [Actinokineospora auranticolor]